MLVHHNEESVVSQLEEPYEPEVHTDGNKKKEIQLRHGCKPMKNLAKP